jgi:hypothetical protein
MDPTAVASCIANPTAGKIVTLMFAITPHHLLMIGSQFWAWERETAFLGHGATVPQFVVGRLCGRRRVKQWGPLDLVGRSRLDATLPLRLITCDHLIGGRWMGSDHVNTVGGLLRRRRSHKKTGTKPKLSIKELRSTFPNALT